MTAYKNLFKAGWTPVSHMCTPDSMKSFNSLNCNVPENAKCGPARLSVIAVRFLFKTLYKKPAYPSRRNPKFGFLGLVRQRLLLGLGSRSIRRADLWGLGPGRAADVDRNNSSVYPKARRPDCCGESHRKREVRTIEWLLNRWRWGKGGRDGTSLIVYYTHFKSDP